MEQTIRRPVMFLLGLFLQMEVWNKELVQIYTDFNPCWNKLGGQKFGWFNLSPARLCWSMGWPAACALAILSQEKSREVSGSIPTEFLTMIPNDLKQKKRLALSCPSNWYRKCATCAIWTRYTLACFAHLTLQRYVFSTTVTRVKSFQNQRFMAKGMKKVTSTIFVYLHVFNGWNQRGCQ